MGNCYDSIKEVIINEEVDNAENFSNINSNYFRQPYEDNSLTKSEFNKFNFSSNMSKSQIENNENINKNININNNTSIDNKKFYTKILF